MYHSPFSVACFSPLRYYIATRSRVLGSRTLFARASSQPALPAGTSQYCDAGTLFLVDALHQPIYRLRSRDRLTCLRWPSRGKSKRSASVWRCGRCATSATAEKRRKAVAQRLRFASTRAFLLASECDEVVCKREEAAAAPERRREGDLSRQRVRSHLKRTSAPVVPSELSPHLAVA